MRKIAFGYSTKCNIRCRHCVAVGESPSSQKMELSRAKEIIVEMAAAQVQGISFTAGEPLIYLADLLELISLCKHYGIYTRVVTNSFWAKDRAKAQEVVAKLLAAGLCQFRLSYSRWHQENVPRANILLAAKISESFGLPYFISFVTDFSELDEQYEAFLQENKLCYFPEPLIWAGRAKDFPASELQTDYQDNCCAMNPYLSPDLQLFACCDAGSHFLKTNFFNLGNLGDQPLGKLLLASESNRLYQQIKSKGITNIASFAGYKSRDIIRYRKCELCEKMFDSPEQLAYLQKNITALEHWHR